MNNRILIIPVLFFFAAANARAYDKIDFKGQILNPAFMKLSAIAVSDGRVYAADAKANAVFIFKADGKLLKKAEAGLRDPEALSFGDGRIYVADTGNSRIVVLDSEGKFLWTFAADGSAPGQLSSPAGVAYGPDSRVYVSNTGNSRIDVFNSDGIYLYGFPVLKTDGITKLNPVKISLDYSGAIYVSDPENGLVQKYDRLGKLLHEYDVPNDGAAPDMNGLLYVITAKEGKVREFSSAGEVIGTFGTRGKGKSEFKKLTDIAIDTDGSIYLCDEENKKVVSIHLEGADTAVKLPRAASLDRFLVKGPSAKYPYKADTFAVTPDNNVVAFMPEAREVVLMSSGSKKTLIRSGSEQGQVKNPKGMFIDAKGLIYVADTGNDRVQIFNADGSYSNMFGESGSEDGNFRAPSSVVVNNKNNIYVADTKNKKIKAYNADGIFLFAAGPQIGNIALQNPVSVCCDAARNVYILDAALKKVIVTDAMGKFLRVWDDSGSLQDPASIVYDNKGFFYVLDKGSFNVKIFDENGKYAASFFAKGRGERELWAPQDLVFRNDRIFISDMENSRIVSFDISYLPEAPEALTAAADDKKVSLSWQAKTNGWTDSFKVYRSAGAGGEMKEAGSSKKTAFDDTSLTPDTTYVYYVAGISVGGVKGVLSEPAQVYFKGPEAPKVEESSAAAAAAGADNKNLAPMEILPGDLNYVFSANYKHYLKNPLGKIAIQNNTDNTFSNVKISFFLRDFMDFPTDSIVAEIAPHAKAEVDIMATLNNRVLNITEDTPVQSQLTVTWYQDGVEKTATLNKPIKMLSKNAIVWDKPARLANFITPKDTPVFGFSRFVLNEKGKVQDAAELLNENVVTALMVWEGLGEHGLSYLSDPVNPYEVLKSSKDAVLDTVQFPRSTLKLKSGDCDDLTALFSSILEAAGVRTALLDYPAHITMMFDTGETDAREAGLPEEYLIKYNNTWWVGLEVTMVGKDFYEAIKHAADFYRQNEKDVNVIEVRSAWAEFEPVTLPETSEESYPDKAKFSARVQDSVAALLKARYNYFKEYFGRILLENADDLDANLNMGILNARQGDADEAVKYFGKVLEKEPFNPAALNDMGNISFGAAKYDEASKYYFKAAKADPYDANIWLNLARAADKQGKKDDVKAFADRAAKIDPGVKNLGDKLLN